MLITCNLITKEHEKKQQQVCELIEGIIETRKMYVI